MHKIVAINWPPKVGRVAASLPFSFISNPVQSAVKPVPNALETLGAKSLPSHVAPISNISGFITSTKSTNNLE